MIFHIINFFSVKELYGKAGGVKEPLSAVTYLCKSHFSLQINEYSTEKMVTCAFLNLKIKIIRNQLLI